MHILPPPDSQLGLAVVLPCHNEPDVITTLASLSRCEPSACAVEVFLIINASETSAASIQTQNTRTLSSVEQWLEEQSRTLPFVLHVIHEPALPAKHAGVGLARKIGMDLAASRLKSVGRPKAPIVNLDADCEVSPNYFCALETHFQQHPKTPGASLYYAHPLTGSFPDAHYEAIAYYELFLRYYTHGLTYAGFPFGFQTVGSAMAVRAHVYQKVGGMNRRKAGEDFYFLHKVIDQGHFTDIRTLTVMPSPRVSERVPFGTGKAIGDFMASAQHLYLQHPLDAFETLKAFTASVPDFYTATSETLPGLCDGLDPVLQSFLQQQKFASKLLEIQNNTTHFESFKKRFFQWFNGFRAMKALHALRDVYGEADVLEHSRRLLNSAYGKQVNKMSVVELLEIYRGLDLSDAPRLLK